jgi:glutamate--cysteine ligase catalytic subunit
MHRAQQRDAVNQAKFYFRRGVFTPTSSRATSGVVTPDIPKLSSPSAASSNNAITNGFQNWYNGRPKQRVMKNYFPSPPPPDEGFTGGNVSEEYAEFTMDEIINGRVRHALSLPYRSVLIAIADTGAWKG